MIVLDQPENTSNNGWKSPQEVEDTPYSIDFGSIYNSAMEIFKKNALHFILFTLVYAAINVVMALIPFLGALASMVINPPLLAGYFLVADKIRNGQTPTFENFFDGFKMNFLQLFLLSLVAGIFIAFGTLFCIIPGIWLAVSYVISTPILLFSGLEFWDAMEASRKIVAKNFWMFLGVLILMFLAGALFTVITCGLGSVIVTPMIYIMIYVMFARLFAV